MNEGWHSNDLQKRLIDRIGIEQSFCVTGGSMEGMLERFHGSVIHKGDSLSGLALIPFAVNREGVFDGQGLL